MRLNFAVFKVLICENRKLSFLCLKHHLFQHLHKNPKIDWHETQPNCQRCETCIEPQGIFTPHSSMKSIAWILFIFAEYIFKTLTPRWIKLVLLYTSASQRTIFSAIIISFASMYFVTYFNLTFSLYKKSNLKAIWNFHIHMTTLHSKDHKHKADFNILHFLGPQYQLILVTDLFINLKIIRVSNQKSLWNANFLTIIFKI